MRFIRLFFPISFLLLFSNHIPVALASSADPVFSTDEMFARPFVAVAVTTNANGKSTKITRSCDGQGHMRLDIDSGSNVMSILYDKNKQECIQLRAARKMALRVKMALGSSGPLAHGKDLGKKEISGHSCKGELIDLDGTATEVWIGQDINYPVQMSFDSPVGRSVTELKSFSAKAPAVDAFVVPPDYKILGAN